VIVLGHGGGLVGEKHAGALEPQPELDVLSRGVAEALVEAAHVLQKGGLR